MKVSETYTIDAACVNCRKQIKVKFKRGEMVPRLIHIWGLKLYKKGDETECIRCACLTFEEVK